MPRQSAFVSFLNLYFKLTRCAGPTTKLALVAHVVARAEVLHLLGQGSVVARGHHARAVAGAAGSRKGDTLDASELGLVVVERLGVRATEGKLASLCVLETQRLPVEELRETLRAVTLVDTLTTRLERKVEENVGELLNRVLDTLAAAVDNVATVVLGRLEEVLHEAAETGKVGGDVGNTHDSALGGSIAEGLVVRGEDTEVATTDKLLVVEAKDRVVGVQELGVEDDLDAVRSAVEELDATDLVENGVVGVVGHVVGHDRGEGRTLKREHTTLEENLVLVRHEFLGVGDLGTGGAVVTSGVLKDALANALGDLLNALLESASDSLTLEGLDGVRVGRCGHNNEGNDGHLGAHLLETSVETRERLDEHVDTLVAELITTSGEQVDRVFKVKVVVAVEVAADKLVNLLLGQRVEVLELVHGRKLDHVETVGQDTIGLALEQVLRLVRGNMRDGREDISAMRRGTFDAVTDWVSNRKRRH